MKAIAVYTVLLSAGVLSCLAANAGRTGHFTPQMDEDGTYSAMQCWYSTNYCWCAAKDGTVLNEPMFGMFYKSCECVREADEIVQTGSGGKVHVPSCMENGLYEAKQCSGVDGSCWCVDQYTGEKLTGPISEGILEC